MASLIGILKLPATVGMSGRRCAAQGPLHPDFDTRTAVATSAPFHPTSPADLSTRLDALFGPMPDEPPIRFKTLAEMCRSESKVRYLVPGILPAGQVGCLVAPVKTLKTSIAADLALSVSTGTPFLGHFPVKYPGKAVFVSGEVGEPTLNDTFGRIAASRAIDLRGVMNLHVSSDLPDIGERSTLRYLATLCEDAALLVIDPWYLCANIGDGGGSMYRVAEKLAPLSRLSQETGASIIAVHHSKYGDPRAKPSLSDAAFAGIREWSRFWILPKHRKPWSNGSSKLWLVTGGSSGHAGDWRVDIEEGVKTPEDSDGRFWQPTVHSGGGDGSDTTAPVPVASGRTNPAANEDETVLAYLRSQRGGATENAIAANAFAPRRKRKAGVKKILDRLRQDGRVTSRHERARGKLVTVWAAA